MDIKGMYEEFRDQHPKLCKSVDAKHLKIWGNVGHETMFSWFESLASTLNDQMGMSEHRTEFGSVFNYFDKKFRNGTESIKNCIEVSFVENLFWQVNPQKAGPIWDMLPKNLQRLYIDFHGRPPS